MTTCPGNKTFLQQGLITTAGDHGGICGRKVIALDHEGYETLEYYTRCFRTTDIRQVGPTNRLQEFP